MRGREKIRFLYEKFKENSNGKNRDIRDSLNMFESKNCHLTIHMLQLTASYL
jgi:hypothetical protein